MKCVKCVKGLVVWEKEDFAYSDLSCKFCKHVYKGMEAYMIEENKRIEHRFFNR